MRVSWKATLTRFCASIRATKKREMLSYGHNYRKQPLYSVCIRFFFLAETFLGFGFFSKKVSSFLIVEPFFLPAQTKITQKITNFVILSLFSLLNFSDAMLFEIAMQIIRAFLLCPAIVKKPSCKIAVWSKVWWSLLWLKKQRVLWRFRKFFVSIDKLRPHSIASGDIQFLCS